MTKKIFPVLVVICLLISMPLTVFAQTGFTDIGGYTDTKNEYTFMTQDAVMIFNKEEVTEDIYEDGVWAGSDLYIPIGIYNEDTRNEVIATDKNIKTDAVELSYKVIQGYDYIDNVSIADGKKLKLSEVPAGVYAKVEFTDNYPKLNSSHVSVRMVLSVNGVSYQNTRITFECDLINRVEEIDQNSVYGAKTPSQFKAEDDYNGEATFDFGGNIKYTARVSQNRRYYLNLDKTPNQAITEAHPDAAYLEFYDFQGNQDTFSSTGKLEIPVDRTKFKSKDGTVQVYPYEIVGDKLQTLVPDTVTFDSKTSKLILRTKTLGAYVLSAEPLMETVQEPDENILKSGYAQTAELPAADGTQPNAAEAAPAPAPTAPEPNTAQALPNDNISTGREINATNWSSDNPDTSGTAPVGAAIAMALLGGIAGIVLWRARPFG